jgi:type IV secretory pathway VirB10-like protein
MRAQENFYMKTCEKCSNPVSDEKAFCPNCGAAMTPERKRTPDYVSEEMGPTMYGYDAPIKNPPAPKPSPPPVEAAAKPVAAEEKPVQAAAEKPVKAEPTSRAPSAPRSSQQQPRVASDVAKAVPKSVPAVNNNRMLHLILGASAVLFALSILVVAILYVTGKL